MSRLTRDGTAEAVSRDQILRHARGQGTINFPCSADHEQEWQPYPVILIHTLLYVMTILQKQKCKSSTSFATSMKPITLCNEYHLLFTNSSSSNIMCDEATPSWKGERGYCGPNSFANVDPASSLSK